jgi:hypothetical protein
MGRDGEQQKTGMSVSGLGRVFPGWYIIIAALKFEDRSRRANVHPITLGPHGSNFADVAKALQPFMVALEGGINLDIRGEEVLMCAFSLAYIGDMPQQNKNAGRVSSQPLLPQLLRRPRTARKSAI